MESKKENYINSVNLNIDTDFPYLVFDVINDKSYPRIGAAVNIILDPILIWNR